MEVTITNKTKIGIYYNKNRTNKKNVGIVIPEAKKEFCSETVIKVEKKVI